jgi:hypothetical protein
MTNRTISEYTKRPRLFTLEELKIMHANFMEMIARIYEMAARTKNIELLRMIEEIYIP